MPRFPRIVSLAVLLLMLPTLTGCSNWRTVNQPLPEVVNAHPRTPLRVRLVDGTRFDVDSGSVRSDSLIVWIPTSPGFVRDPTTGDIVLQESEVQSIPLLNVSAIQVRNPPVKKGVAIVGGLIASVLAIVLLGLHMRHEFCKSFGEWMSGCR